MSKRIYKPSPCFGSFIQEGASGKCKIDVKTQDGKKRKVPLGCHKTEEDAARALTEYRYKDGKGELLVVLSQAEKDILDAQSVEDVLAKYAPTDTTSKFRGVSKSCTGWQVKMTILGESQTIGTFSTEEDAARWYDSVAVAQGRHTLNFDASDYASDSDGEEGMSISELEAMAMAM